VSEYAQAQALWYAAYNHFGRVDIWINNARFKKRDLVRDAAAYDS
jgi:hypothetical protein